MASPKINGTRVSTMSKDALLSAVKDNNNRKHINKAVVELNKRGIEIPSE